MKAVTAPKKRLKIIKVSESGKEKKELRKIQEKGGNNTIKCRDVDTPDLKEGK